MSIIYINPYQFAAAAGYDADAQDFINRVIAADVAAGNTSGLEVGVRNAYNEFFVGCKVDGTFNALKAACIMIGARTLAGALVPLVGPAPTNFNFVAGDYDRETGLKGNGSTKRLDSNRASNADPQNNVHQAVYISSVNSGNFYYMGQDLGGSTGATAIFRFGSSFGFRNRSNSYHTAGSNATGFAGHARASSSEYLARVNSTSSQIIGTSQTPASANTFVFASDLGAAYSDARLAFYSIGESLDLALLDARVTALVNAIDAAIP